MSWEHPLDHHIDQLYRHFPIEHDPEARVVVIEIGFPDGWEPTQSPLRFDIPSEYPVEPPQVYVIESMESEYEGTDRLFRPTPEAGWKQVSWNTALWDGSHGTLLTATGLVLRDFERPAQMEV